MEDKIAMLAPLVAARGSNRIGTAETRSQARHIQRIFSASSPVKDIWGRITIDIATFLAAMESLSADESEENYQALLQATDRLLCGSALTRLELDRLVRAQKRGPSVRRMSG